MTKDILQSPVKFHCGVEFKNRMVLAPMTNGQSHPDGRISDAEVRWLAMRAEGGFGALVSAASHVQKDALSFAGQLGCFSDDQVAGLAAAERTCKAAGAPIVLQIYHGGLRVPRALTGVQPTAPSSVQLDFPGFETPRELTDAEIESIAANFVAAAMRAKSAGMVGVEIHGANGYLFTQFLSSITNKRKDRWGGNLEGRARLIVETARHIRAAAGPSFLIGARLLPEDAPNQRGFDVEEMLTASNWLADAGIDYLHLSSGNVRAKPWLEPDKGVSTIRRFRDGLPKRVKLIACGGIKSLDDATYAIAQGADLIALGKAAILEPAWPRDALAPGHTPASWPVTEARLAELGVSGAFVTYLRKFNKLVM